MDLIAPDASYMARVGVEYATPLRLASSLTLSLGARIEGVPVHDLVGSSNGFRRPADYTVMLSFTRQFGT